MKAEVMRNSRNVIATVGWMKGDAERKTIRPMVISALTMNSEPTVKVNIFLITIDQTSLD